MTETSYGLRDLGADSGRYSGSQCRLRNCALRSASLVRGASAVSRRQQGRCRCGAKKNGATTDGNVKPAPKIRRVQVSMATLRNAKEEPRAITSEAARERDREGRRHGTKEPVLLRPAMAACLVDCQRRLSPPPSPDTNLDRGQDHRCGEWDQQADAMIPVVFPRRNGHCVDTGDAETRIRRGR